MIPALGAGCGCAATAVAGLLCVPLLLTATTSAPPAAVTGAPVRPAAPGVTSCTAAVSCQTVPVELPWVAAGFAPDRFTSPPGQCTSWAAALWPGADGRGVTWGGDAWEWLANAAAVGIGVSTEPSVGAIAVFPRTASVGGEWGHVAVVLAVTPTSIDITEMNWRAPFVVDERTLPWPGAGTAGFIPLPAGAGR